MNGGAEILRCKSLITLHLGQAPFFQPPITVFFYEILYIMFIESYAEWGLCIFKCSEEENTNEVSINLIYSELGHL